LDPESFRPEAFCQKESGEDPRCLAYISLPSSHEYWGNLGVVGVEVELSWKDRARQVNDLARLYAVSGEHYSNCLIVGGNKSIVKSLRHALETISGKDVRLGEDDVVEIPLQVISQSLLVPRPERDRVHYARRSRRPALHQRHLRDVRRKVSGPVAKGTL
jgi:hypothetical protein